MMMGGPIGFWGQRQQALVSPSAEVSCPPTNSMTDITRPLRELPQGASTHSCPSACASTVKELGDHFDRLRGFPSQPFATSSGSPKVFGVGLPRTGTTSLNEALNELGIRSTQYSAATVEDLLVMPTAGDVKGFSVDIVRRWDDFSAVTDAPMPYFFEELLLMYPNAKFILTVRNVTQWWPSLKAHLERNPAPSALALATLSTILGSERPNEYFAIKSYLQHNKLVQAIVPPEQLLVMDLAEGSCYSKLCKFLGIEKGRCPPDDQFPRSQGHRM
ncbi:Sulfotransferase family protein [Balamuthia mandrillaris]